MEAQNKGPKPKREERDYDEENDTFVDAETCWSDNEDYFSTVEEQPPLWRSFFGSVLVEREESV
jgi:hypothetical protein